jgi:Zn-dependent protease with chaperone function
MRQNRPTVTSMRKGVRISALLASSLFIMCLSGTCVEMGAQASGQQLNAEGEAALQRIIDSAHHPDLRSRLSQLLQLVGDLTANAQIDPNSTAYQGALGTILAAQDVVNATGLTSQFNIQAQTACEGKMLGNIGAREVFSGKAYGVLTEIARAYGLPIPHLYVFSGSPNMAYIAGSTAVDGRGKILVGQQAIKLFDTIALKGFLGHEMAHLVSDRAAQGCNDYILRDPQVEADADALAARTLGTGPVKAFLQRVLALTQGQNWDARQRLKVLQ